MSVRTTIAYPVRLGQLKCVPAVGVPGKVVLLRFKWPAMILAAPAFRKAPPGEHGGWTPHELDSALGMASPLGHLAQSALVSASTTLLVVGVALRRFITPIMVGALALPAI